MISTKVRPIFRVLLVGFIILVVLSNQPYKINLGLITGEWTTYQDSQVQLTIDYPGNWALYTAPIRGFNERRIVLVSKPFVYNVDKVPLGEITIDHVILNEASVDALVEWSQRYDCTKYGNFCNVLSPPQLEEYIVQDKQYFMRNYRRENNDGETILIRQIYLLRNIDGFVVSLRARETEFNLLIPYFKEFLNRIQLAS